MPHIAASAGAESALAQASSCKASQLSLQLTAQPKLFHTVLPGVRVTLFVPCMQLLSLAAACTCCCLGCLLPVGTVLWVRHLQAGRADPPGSLLCHAQGTVQEAGSVDGSGKSRQCRKGLWAGIAAAALHKVYQAAAGCQAVQRRSDTLQSARTHNCFVLLNAITAAPVMCPGVLYILAG